ncbi:MAG: toll/interleukin-1 receptor domain-containing protein [Desulfobacteraceae bacterium]|nr:toll/interleukin-1 receptor domain-containing protein [Desulfobacteraceae bacterium]
MENVIFVSYARTDGEFALKLAKDLRAANVNIWMDQLDIKAGDTWDRAVEDALHRCIGLIVVLSPRTVSSRSVMDEVSFAIEENKKVVPVLYQACKIPFRLRRVQRTDFTSDYSAGLSKLADALRETPMSSDRKFTAESSAPSFADFGAQTVKTKPRVSRESYWSSLHPRLVTALCVGLAGAILGGVASALIYANDNRLGTIIPSLMSQAVLGGLIAGLLWAIAGAIAGPKRAPLVSAISTSLFAPVVWIWLGGTYEDVMWAAVIFGWPIGGMIGATISLMILKISGKSR